MQETEGQLLLQYLGEESKGQRCSANPLFVNLLGVKLDGINYMMKLASLFEDHKQLDLAAKVAESALSLCSTDAPLEGESMIFVRLMNFQVIHLKVMKMLELFYGRGVVTVCFNP